MILGNFECIGNGKEGYTVVLGCIIRVYCKICPMFNYWVLPILVMNESIFSIKFGNLKNDAIFILYFDKNAGFLDVLLISCSN